MKPAFVLLLGLSFSTVAFGRDDPGGGISPEVKPRVRFVFAVATETALMGEVEIPSDWEWASTPSNETASSCAISAARELAALERSHPEFKTGSWTIAIGTNYPKDAVSFMLAPGTVGNSRMEIDMRRFCPGNDAIEDAFEAELSTWKRARGLDTEMELARRELEAALAAEDGGETPAAADRPILTSLEDSYEDDGEQCTPVEPAR